MPVRSTKAYVGTSFLPTSRPDPPPGVSQGPSNAAGRTHVVYFFPVEGSAYSRHPRCFFFFFFFGVVVVVACACAKAAGLPPAPRPDPADLADLRLSSDVPFVSKLESGWGSSPTTTVAKGVCSTPPRSDGDDGAGLPEPPSALPASVLSGLAAGLASSLPDPFVGVAPLRFLFLYLKKSLNFLDFLGDPSTTLPLSLPPTAFDAPRSFDPLGGGVDGDEAALVPFPPFPAHGGVLGFFDGVPADLLLATGVAGLLAPLRGAALSAGAGAATATTTSALGGRFHVVIRPSE
ncbi:hypothetical protein ACHAWF_013490 [Thalassiosira exigua]